MKRILCWGALLLLAGLCSAQRPDSLAIPTPADPKLELASDSSRVKKKEFKGDFPNPRKALFYSIIPGGGQVYNRRWWKLPFVYGAFGGMIYAIDYNTRNYKRMRNALILQRKGEIHEFSGTGIDNETSLKSLRDQFDKNRQLSFIGLFFVYALQSVEAFVDAHLKSFDIDEDIGFQLQPQVEIIPVTGKPLVGLGIIIPLGREQARMLPDPF